MAIGLLLATSVLAFQGSVVRSVKNGIAKQELVYLAEAGLDKGLQALHGSSTYAGETLTLDGATIEVAVTTGANSNERIISSIATRNGKTYRLRVKAVASSDATAVAFSYGLQVGDGGLSVGNNAQIIGSVYSNQNISGGNNSVITGDALAVGTITNVTVNGQRLTGQPIEPLPIFDQNFWRAKAQEGGTIAGPYTPANGESIGPVYINGNLTFETNRTVVISGPVYVSGQITFRSGATVQIANTLGQSGAMLITEQKLVIGNSWNGVANDQGGYLLVVTTSSADDAVSISNNLSGGLAPFYAPNGGIIVGNNLNAVALTARKLTTGNNLVLTYDEGLANATFTTGPGGAWVFQKGTYQEY